MFDKQRILDIARNAVNDKGYVLYADFDEYVRELICKKRLLQPTKAGFSQYEIKTILLNNGYKWRRKREAQFYLPR